MPELKRLPDSEFEIMKIVWASPSPVTANIVLDCLPKKGWKATTVISFLLRLVDKQFLRTEKNGKERTFYPLIAKADYFKVETGDFLRRYQGNSFVSLVNTLYADHELGDEDLNALLEWAKEKNRGETT